MDRIINAKGERYDHGGAFKKWGYIDWRQNKNCDYTIGDIVYLYCTAPIKKIMFRTVVEKINLTVDEIVDDYEFWSDKTDYHSSPTGNYVRLKLLSMIDDTRLSMDYLKDNGIVSQSETFQGSRIKANNIKLFTHIENIFSGIIDQKALAIEQQNKQRENELLFAESIENDMDEIGIEGLDRITLTKARVNQSIFRKNLIRKYHKCCLCDVSSADLLIASHIKPWSDCEPSERLLSDNGLLLCPNHDKLFDSGLISFDENGLIMISENISNNDCKAMGISMQRIVMTEKMSEFMAYHRSIFGFDN